MINAEEFKPNEPNDNPTDKQAAAGEIECPKEYRCSILMTIMSTPTVCSDGYSYELDAIIKHLNNDYTSPITRQPIVTVALNRALLDSIERFLKENPQFKKEQYAPIQRGKTIQELQTELDRRKSRLGYYLNRISSTLAYFSPLVGLVFMREQIYTNAYSVGFRRGYEESYCTSRIEDYVSVFDDQPSRNDYNSYSLMSHLLFSTNENYSPFNIFNFFDHYFLWGNRHRQYAIPSQKPLQGFFSTFIPLTFGLLASLYGSKKSSKLQKLITLLLLGVNATLICSYNSKLSSYTSDYGKYAGNHFFNQSYPTLANCDYFIENNFDFTRNDDYTENGTFTPLILSGLISLSFFGLKKYLQKKYPLAEEQIEPTQNQLSRNQIS